MSNVDDHTSRDEQTETASLHETGADPIDLLDAHH